MIDDGGGDGVWLTISRATSVLLKELKVNREDSNASRWHNTFLKPESHSRVAMASDPKCCITQVNPEVSRRRQVARTGA